MLLEFMADVADDPCPEENTAVIWESFVVDGNGISLLSTGATMVPNPVRWDPSPWSRPTPQSRPWALGGGMVDADAAKVPPAMASDVVQNEIPRISRHLQDLGCFQ